MGFSIPHITDESDLLLIIGTGADMKQHNKALAKRKRMPADTKKRIPKLDNIFKRLYKDNISGKPSAFPSGRFVPMRLDGYAAAQNAVPPHGSSVPLCALSQRPEF